MSQALLKELTGNPNIYADAKLIGYVRDKVTYIEKLKSSLGKMTTEEHNFSKLREYLKFMQEVENVDFSYEIGRVKDKIEMLEQTNAILKDDGKSKTTMDKLDSLA